MIMKRIRSRIRIKSRTQSPWTRLVAQNCLLPTTYLLRWDEFRARNLRVNCNDLDRRDMMEVRRKAGRATAFWIASVEELSTSCHHSALARTRTSRS